MCLPGAHGGHNRVSDPVTGVMEGCEPSCGCWGPNLGPQKEHQVLLTSELFLQPFCVLIKIILIKIKIKVSPNLVTPSCS